MTEPFTSDPLWYQALPLAERAALPDPPQEGEDALAAQRLLRWQGQAPFDGDGLFTRRLATVGLGAEAFRRLLGETPASLRGRASPPPWLLDLEEALTDPAPRAEIPAAAHGRSDFVAAAGPLLAWACRRLRQGSEALAAGCLRDSRAPFDPARVPEAFFHLLVFPVNLALGRALAVELHIARQQGLLSGATPEERFRGFVAGLAEPARCLELLRTFPVLARQLVTALRQWIDTALEVLGRLAADWDAVCGLFHPGGDPGRLAEAGAGAGDRHRGGRCVLILRFESGFRLVYKPKPMAVDLHFQELLGWMNERGQEPPFRQLRILDRGRYGWEELAAAAPCAEPAEVDRFYARTGGLLALLYALEATDVHLENLIAAGEHPVLVDLESLFHARAERLDAESAADMAQRTMGHSVLRPGLLPQRTGADLEHAGTDLSALGGSGGQRSPAPLPDFEAAGTDALRLVRRHVELPPAQNRPHLEGREADVLAHSPAFLAGFAAACRLLIAHRGELLAPEGPIERFAADEVRAILRPTMSYMRLLQESCHPHVLQSALERDRLLDRLWESAALPEVDGLIAAEHADLWQGDVPVFTTRPDSRDLWDSRGRRTADFCDEPALASVRRRLLALDEADIARQSWFIRASLTTLAINTEGGSIPHYAMAPPRRPAGRAELLAAARALGDRLEGLAVRGVGGGGGGADGGAGNASWIGLSILTDHWALVPLGPDLYSGVTGIAFFLAHLGERTGEARSTELAIAALGTARRQLAAGAAILPAAGAFTGWGSLVWALCHLAALWGDPALLDEAEAIAAGPLAEVIESDATWDVTAGCAGAALSLLVLHGQRPSRRTLDLAERCGERLLAGAVPQSDEIAEGIAWPAPGARPLSGFSHGTAGIVWALARLADATGDERFREAAAQGLRYERSLFSPAAGNWRDLRDVPRPAGSVAESDFFMNAWCHGAPGIGLARLLTRPHLDDPQIQTEIDAALATTLREGFGLGHCLCHGDLGNLEPFLIAGRQGDTRWSAEVERLSGVILESIERDGWLCGVPQGLETPGLMTGLAGIGYGLLRLADPDRVPSVLALEGPRAGREART